MPVYPTATPSKPRLLVEGYPEYLFGSLDLKRANLKALITNSALATNVVTLTVQIIEGNIPAVGDTVLISQSQSTSGALNGSAVLTGVSITASTGAGTLTYALTHADIGSAADSGTVTGQVPESYEALANGASVAVTPSFQDAQADGARTFTLVVLIGAVPTAATFNLQAAERDNPNEYSNIGTPITWVSGTGVYMQSYTLSAARFYRVQASGVTGTSPTFLAKIMS